MSADKQQDFELPTGLTFPLKLVEPLSTLVEAERGNTPRPSKARLGFVSGIAAIQKKQFESAWKQLLAAVQEAEKDKKDKETNATCMTGLGYLCIILKEHERAAVCYKTALKLWQKVHASAQSKLLPFMIDTSNVCERAGQLEDAYSVLEQARQIAIEQSGQNDPEVQGLTVGLASIRVKQSKFTEAETLYGDALKILHDNGSVQEVQLLHLMIALQESQNKSEEVAKLKALLKSAEDKHKSSASS